MIAALSYQRFEAIRHKFHSKNTFKNPSVKGRKEVFAPETFELKTVSSRQSGKKSG
jgi:hypothetical protein